MNQLRIRASCVAHQPLRYTPAGVPVAEASFQFSGSVVEAGEQRQLDFEFAAIAIGPVALMMDRAKLGETADIAGFIAPKSRRSSRLIVHVAEFVIVEIKTIENTEGV